MQRLLHLHRVHEFRTRAEIARKQQKSAHAGSGNHHQTNEAAAAAAAAYAQAAAIVRGKNPLQSSDSEVQRSGLTIAQAPPKQVNSSVARELNMINNVDETADPVDRLSMLLMQIKRNSGMGSGPNLTSKRGSFGGESLHAKFVDDIAQTLLQLCCAIYIHVNTNTLIYIYVCVSAMLHEYIYICSCDITDRTAKRTSDP
jgi:hypothetical protein